MYLKEHIYTKVVRILGIVEGWDSWDGLTCLTFGACTSKEHLHQRWARIVEDSPG
jgi:hypothetical protein